ncbi:MAG: glycosyltransferase family 8 protein [Clostridia bacterium]|nr:glycosyltransferase family 8 protein [Clostridia bacterium]
MTETVIPVFFSADDRYIPYCAVAVSSLIEGADPAYTYHIHILNTGIEKESAARVRQMERENVRIFFDDVTEGMKRIAGRMDLRDYYSASIYFRIFIPALFPQYDKGIYLDSDVVVSGDIARLFEASLDGNLVGAVPDEVIASCKEFIRYAERGCGIPHGEYFNSGVLLMDLAALRDFDLEERYIDLLVRYRFDTVCPDQDYLNVLCRGRVRLLDRGWNKMSVSRDYDGLPRLVHYNMFNKPWQYDGIPYGELFWKHAARSPFYSEICAVRDRFSEAEAEVHRKGLSELVRRATEIADSERNFRTVLFEGVTV